VSRALATRRRVSPLRAARFAQGFTVAELARRAGVSKQCMGRMEWQLPAMWRRLSRLADVLGTTTDALLGRSPLLMAPAAGPEDRALLDAMQRDAEALLGPPLLRLVGGWRRIARAAWSGVLYRIRDHETRCLPRAAKQLPAVSRGVPLPKAPKGWYSGWPVQPRKPSRIPSRRPS
jgi:transcriptional regulator with XRE-family HTH domain